MAYRCLLIAIMTGVCASVPLRAESPETDERFTQQVAPILAQHCSRCHGEKLRAGLDLSTRSGVLRGAKSASVIVPGKAAQSLLVQVLAEDADPHMPPRKQLTSEETATLARWIDGLAPDTRVGAQPQLASDHWAFQPIERSVVPTVKDRSWPRSPVDAFVLARLEEAGLSPSPPAGKETLLRRLYFDLIGLPPSPEAVASFLEDDAPDAYERVVDRLLASPNYGERWGRHWLDLARYADSSGFHQDFDRPSAWRYRDYVIASFNSDKPYTQFIHEQLAGDQLPKATAESWIATGFGRNGPSNDDNMGKGAFLEKYRMDQLDDIVSTTSNVFLGLTVGCARCHDHKYDPITQYDYYRFVAYFNSTAPQRLVLDGFQSAKPTLRPASSKRDKLTPITARVLTDRGQKPKPTHILWRGDVRNRGPVVEPNIPEALRDTNAESDRSSRLSLAQWIADSDNPLTWRVMANRIWAHHFGRGLVATPSNFGTLGERPTHPELLDWLADELRSSGGLKSLHRLLVTSAVYRQSSDVSLADAEATNIDPDNRLLWRRDKRRLEAEPLRDAFLTVSGQLNPVMGGRGIKPRIRPELLVASQRNKWPVVIEEGPEHWRRSVYIYVKRQLQLPLMELFDAPTSTHSCARRSKSLVPTQSLVLMNDEFVREQARFFANRVVREVGLDLRSQTERALWIALGRQPVTRRVDDAVAFVDAQTNLLIGEGKSPETARREALADCCHVLMNLSEFVYVD